jgi:orotate phosphoribosyltransferase
MSAEISQQLQSIVDYFFIEKVMQVDAGRPFVLSSGLPSPVYLDHRRAFTNPQLRQRLTQAWAEQIEIQLKEMKLKPQNVVCAGTATAGIAPAMALADYWNASFIYVRQKPKEHGTQQLVEGAFEPSRPHLVIDDMLTTGQSLMRAVDGLKQSGAKVVCATTVTSHGLAIAEAQLKEHSLPYVSLFKTPQILEIAQGLGLISQADLRTVSEWLEGLDLESMSVG